ncbi:lytic transglycosylase domain-containing protein [Fimbriimonas ginsengisoli]|uniref:Putative transglycosylase n=1 Tax=Fimbriimonas ginsengisoli Gsoil 348 TaxID=661478 RepID=A0A068NTR8_FIMGI|nr:lytic transglycosylase domain-containing protein [Fimbriimonas ginsengisoli]AIE84994.1 putative transglycosylase [Fimbriimonas ginsengisoli Gsoil 348]
MNRLFPIVVLVAAAALAPAQSLSNYLRLRKEHHIAQASATNLVQSVVGTKVLEIQGTVKGSFRIGNKTTLVVERPEGGSLEVETDVVPDWMVGTESPARLLVKIIHPDEVAPLRVLMLGAAHEEEIRSIEIKPAKKKAGPPAPRTVASEGLRNSRSALFGPISRSGSRLVRQPGDRVVSLERAIPEYAAFIKRENRKLSDAEAVRMAQALVGFSDQYRVDPRLVVAIILAESGFDPNSVSHSGAVGLGQLMPGTARWMGVRNAFDSVDNLYGMIKLIRTHLDQYHRQTGEDFQSLVLTLAAYNAGEGAVRRYKGIPPYRETQHYVIKVIKKFIELRGYGM